jgi:hypothetical protein
MVDLYTARRHPTEPQRIQEIKSGPDRFISLEMPIQALSSLKSLLNGESRENPKKIVYNNKNNNHIIIIIIIITAKQTLYMQSVY